MVPIMSSLDLSEHICGMLVNRRFLVDIHFRSFTYYHPNKVVIFEGDSEYFIPITDISSRSMRIPLEYNHWKDKELKHSAEMLEQNELFKSSYMINLGKVFALILATNLYDRMINIYHPNKPKQVSKKVKSYPDYSIVHDQKSDNDAYGFIIHKGSIHQSLL